MRVPLVLQYHYTLAYLSCLLDLQGGSTPTTPLNGSTDNTLTGSSGSSGKSSTEQLTMMKRYCILVSWKKNEKFANLKGENIDYLSNVLSKLYYVGISYKKMIHILLYNNIYLGFALSPLQMKQMLRKH